MRQTKSWILPILVSIVLFIAVRPTFAQLVGGEVGDLGIKEVGSEVGENGFRQIYYTDTNNNKRYITNTNYTNGEPQFAGDNIVWMGQAVGGNWRVFRYHIPSASTLELTGGINNANPKVSSDGKVVWEGWVEDEDGGKWQIFFFDGVKITQLTSGDLSLNPDIEGDYIAYARRDISGTWRSVVYSISQNKAMEVTTGTSSKKPKVRGGKILLAGEGVEKEFPLTVEDLFLLNLVPLSATESAALSPTPTPVPDKPESVTIEEVTQELEGTLEVVEEEATSAADVN